jgi:hypothetical protein
MQQWAEEVMLLQEEIQQTLVFCETWATWWDNHSSLCSNDILLDIHDGIRAYAAKQAGILHSRGKQFAKMWATPGVEGELEPSAAAEDEASDGE